MPLTIKSIKGYIFHNYLEKDFDDDEKKYTYAACYELLADSINNQFKPKSKITKQNFKNNEIDPCYLSFCYSLLAEPDFKEDVQHRVRHLITFYNEGAYWCDASDLY